MTMPAKVGARRLQKRSMDLTLVLTVASLEVSYSHKQTTQSFSTEILAATEAR